VIALALIAAASAAPPPNLLLVTIDTLRADRLHAYGYTAIETPATDRLARAGVLVQDATVQAPQTRPSHASILTGRWPFEHGIRDNFSPPLDPRHPTLATALRARGYATGAFIGSVVLAQAGLDRGFQTYDAPFAGAQRAARDEERPAAAVVGAALAWLKPHAQGAFFAWVHLYDPHYPYEPPEPFAHRYAAHPYDGEVAYADAQLGRLLDFLDASGLASRTLVVVTSDHGEGLGEHGEDEHMLFVYDSTLHVPLLLFWPGVLPAGAKLPGQFRSVDLMPTVLDLLGAPAPAGGGGSSRAAALRSGARLGPSESYAESLYGSIHFGTAPLVALRAEGFKLIDAPRPELYDLREDPGETHNLFEQRATVAERMRERLRSYQAVPSRVAPAVSADAGTLERMAALGYVGVTASRAGAATGTDPKDKAPQIQAFTRDSRQAVRLFQDGDVDGALAVLSRLSQSEFLSLEVQHLLGRALLRKRRYGEAAQALEEATTLMPQFIPAWTDLSRAYLALGRRDMAAAGLERGVRANPGASVLRVALSAVYRDRGDSARAIAELREAVRADPASADAWNALGLLLTASGQESEAVQAFESGLKANPEDPDLLFNLAERRSSAGRSAEAARLLERVSAESPGYPGLPAALKRARADAAPPPAGTMRLRLLRVADRARAEDVARRLAAGEDFAALARAVSKDASAAQGGDLGRVRVADLAEPLRSAARALAPGAVSPPLQTDAGYVLLKREP
jgi:choline-sulfatase